MSGSGLTVCKPSACVCSQPLGSGPVVVRFNGLCRGKLLARPASMPLTAVAEVGNLEMSGQSRPPPAVGAARQAAALFY